MPPLNLERLNGGSWRLADHRGEVIVINYWASWCAPCWEEAPMLSRIGQELAPQRLTIVGVAMDERRSGEIPQGVRRFVDTLRIPYAIALNPAMSQMAYGMDGLPTTLLVDRQGRVAAVYVGEVREKALRRDLKILLLESSGAAH